jgi:chorismate synthase
MIVIGPPSFIHGQTESGMNSNTFGTIFSVTTFGESHSPGVGAVISGCPPRLPLTELDIQAQLDRRRPGQSHLTTSRQEGDKVRILSGVEDGITLGTPIGLLVENQNHRPGDYKEFSNIPRPSHADYTYRMKYGVNAASGGGRASARETIGRVAAGAVAEKLLWVACGIEIVAWVSQVRNVLLEPGQIDMGTISREQVDRSPVRCPIAGKAADMEEEIMSALGDKDSVGGIITCVCRNVPAGLGEPVFDKLDAKLAQAMLSLPATKGFEIGSGFNAARLTGSAHNDLFTSKEGRLGTLSNRSGGSQGGISNGEPICFSVVFKPVATIGQPQRTVDYDGNPAILEGKGRHDACVLPRAVPMVETMAALVLADLWLRQRAVAVL